MIEAQKQKLVPERGQMGIFIGPLDHRAGVLMFSNKNEIPTRTMVTISQNLQRPCRINMIQTIPSLLVFSRYQTNPTNEGAA